MENIDLIEMRKNIAFLPTLRERAQALERKISEAEENVQRLLDKYKAESLDVEKLESNSLFSLIVKNFGRYEDKMEKESEEMYAAKLEYDKACTRLEDLRKEEEDAGKRIASLLQFEQEYDRELRNRENILRIDKSSEVSLKYQKLESEQDSLARQLAETGEAYDAGKRVISTADNALSHLNSAENWATFDMFTRGGIISHMAKYSHIDNAKDDFNRLNYQLEDLQKELQDLNLSGVSSLDGIDSTTRTIDFWLDNIFTDMHIRNRIHEDSCRVSELRDKISSMMYSLSTDMTRIQNRLKELESEKNELLVNETVMTHRTT